MRRDQRRGAKFSKFPHLSNQHESIQEWRLLQFTRAASTACDSSRRGDETESGMSCFLCPGSLDIYRCHVGSKVAKRLCWLETLRNRGRGRVRERLVKPLKLGGLPWSSSPSPDAWEATPAPSLGTPFSPKRSMVSVGRVVRREDLSHMCCHFKSP